MKVAVPIPDPVFAAAGAPVKQLGTTRSELFARALNAFPLHPAPDRMAEAMNAVTGEVGSESEPFVRGAGRQIVRRVE